MEVKETFTARERIINCHDLSFTCVYGRHINGAFVAITNWGVAAELSICKSDLQYNRKKILEALERSTETFWLPSDEEERSAIARDLAMIIAGLINQM